MKEKYKLTPEHEAMLPAWRDKWIANAMSTKAMDEHDKSEMRKAIKGLYEAANITPPPENRIVFVPSPFVARFAGGFAAALWHQRKNGKDAATDDATDDATTTATTAATSAVTRLATSAATDAATTAATTAATRAATTAATRSATSAATTAATDDATDDATTAATDAATTAATSAATTAATSAVTRSATTAATTTATYAATTTATDAATSAVTRLATSAATDDATYAALKNKDSNNKWYGGFEISAMVQLSVKLGVGEFGLKCASLAWRMYQGGNFWSAWESFLSFFRHVAKLDIDYSRYEHWEKAAIHGSYRIMHPDFCIISDRPKTLLVDEENRPHCFNGPFCEWRDGSKLYSIHGTRVPGWICETPANEFTKEMILSEENADNRRCIIQKIGYERAVEIMGAEVSDVYESKVGGKYELLMIDYDGTGAKRPHLKMPNPSIDAVHIEGIGEGSNTVQDAICFRNGLAKFVEPEFIS